VPATFLLVWVNSTRFQEKAIHSYGRMVIQRRYARNVISQTDSIPDPSFDRQVDDLAETGGRIGPESLDDLLRNRWTISAETGGRIRAKQVDDLLRNMQFG
jgi:hypothetical protein